MKPVALLLALLLALPVRGEEPVHVYIAPVPAPPSYAAVQWQFSTSTAPGYWFTEAQVIRVDTRLRYLETKAAQECFDKTVEADRKFLLSPKAVILLGAAGLLLGVGLGVYIHQRITH